MATVGPTGSPQRAPRAQRCFVVLSQAMHFSACSAISAVRLAQDHGSPQSAPRAQRCFVVLSQAMHFSACSAISSVRLAAGPRLAAERAETAEVLRGCAGRHALLR